MAAAVTSGVVALMVEANDCPWGMLADALGELPDVSAVAIFVVSDTAEHLVPYRVSGRHAWTLKQLAIPVGERMSGWVAAVGQPMLNADAMLDLFDVPAESLRCAAAVPGRGPGGADAVITLYSTRAEAFLPLHTRLVDGALALVALRETAARARADMQRDEFPSYPSNRSRLRAVPSDRSTSDTQPSRTRTRRAV
jgi:hypothetical protein